MNTDNKDGNIRNKESKPRKWSKKEMEEAEPFPIPEVEEESDAGEQDDNGGSA